MSPSVLIRTRAVSDVEVAGSRVKTSVSLRRDTCRGGHVEAVFFSPCDNNVLCLLIINTWFAKPYQIAPTTTKPYQIAPTTTKPYQIATTTTKL